MTSDSAMEWADTLRERVDRDQLLVDWFLPGAVAVGTMAVCFVLVAVVLLTNEPLINGALWTRLLTLVTMLLLPHLVAGLWFGRRHGIAARPPVAAGVAPIVVLVLAFVVHGGPVLTPFLVPLTTLAAVASWTVVFTVGMAASARFTGES